jgi:two-component system, sensor histidine kinase ChiS
MASISLKRLIGKKNETVELFENLLHLTSDRIGIEDDEGNLLFGVNILEPATCLPVTVNNEILGWVKGGEQAKILAGIIQHYALKESERKTLGQEVLTMYREINVIYDFSEKLAEAIDPEAIARLALEEAGHLIKSGGGMVLMGSQEEKNKTLLIATTGISYPVFKKLAAHASPLGAIETIEGAEIINDLGNDRRFRGIPGAMIYAPLKVKQRILGLIVLMNENGTSYTAADLKLLTTLGLMAASAIESAMLYKKIIEEARVREETLKKVDRMKDEFLANTSHELRTPLNGIIGLSESLFDRMDQRDQQEDLSMIIASGKRLANLVNDLLDFSKLKNFDITLQRKPVDLHSVADIVLRISAPLISGKKIELRNNIPEDFRAADGDENRLQQILSNLVGNAVKFTESGYVEITASLKDELITVKVKDTGIGVPENKWEVIFQEFQQADGSIAREYAGTGLGLSISKHLVELHGGKIWVESTPGDGAIFYFTLPAADKKAALRENHQELSKVFYAGDHEDSLSALSGQEAENLLKNDKSLINILIVDDEPINHQVLKNHLSSGTFRITRAMNGEEALKALENGMRYNLVILDVMMPRMTGYEVCQKIREKYVPSELPVIMVTAKNQVKDLVQGLNIGANDYLAKPFTKQEFLARINTQLDLHRIFDVTGRFVPNEFIRSLGKERITDVFLGDQAHQEVSVLFSDIRDYTTLSEEMTPTENFNFINSFNQRIGPNVQKNKGFINQYLGDAIMALFTDSPEDGLKASVSIQQVIVEYNKERVAKGRKPIRVGIGLHTGPLIMGIIGDDKRLDAAIISDTVNTASRIESLSKYFQSRILLSEACMERLPDRKMFNFRYLGRVRVKGKNNTLRIYECFDGDEPEMIRNKKKINDLFHEGMNAYTDKKFAEASLVFREVSRQIPEDHVARLFLQKSELYMLEGVPDNWEGVEIMVSK